MTITDDTECLSCGEKPTQRTCENCGVSAMITDCGCKEQPRPIAADGHHNYCDECSDAHGEYMQIMFAGDAWGEEVTEAEHEAAMGRMQAWLDRNKPDGFGLVVADGEPGEIAATYRVYPNGDRQILGYSAELPDLVRETFTAAWEHACETWPAKGQPGGEP